MGDNTDTLPDQAMNKLMLKENEEWQQKSAKQLKLFDCFQSDVGNLRIINLIDEQ